MTAPRRGLGIFYKEPTPGRVKTRLTPPLRAAEASELYAALLSDTIQMVNRESLLDLVILFDADEPPGWRPAAPADWLHLPQAGVDLGERMEAGLGELLNRLPGGRACLIGSDAPLLDDQVLESAFHALAEGADMVTSPTPDGGYGLIGVSRKPPDGLLSGIAWSTRTVLHETEAAAHRSGWSTARALPCQDIDTEADLSVFLTKLNAENSEQQANSAPATRRCLARLLAAGRLRG